MTFRVTILGSSSALPTPQRNPTAHVLNVHEQFFLIDCGEGTQGRLQRAGINPLRINAVFISHLHGDHLYGIYGLISTLGLLGRRTPLCIYAPHPFGEILAAHLRYFDTDLCYEVQWHEVDTRKHALLYENKVLEVWSVPLRHRLPTSGYWFREKQPPLNLRKDWVDRYQLGIAQCVAAKRGEDVLLEDGRILQNRDLTYTPYQARSYAYLSDTLYSARAAHRIEGVDLLYHEATFMEQDRVLARRTGHSTARQAAQAAVEAGAGRLLLGHFSSRYSDLMPLLAEAQSLFPATALVEEGRSYEIPLVRNAPE
ncbi:MAG: ribonuclease Z [Alistipes sp.]|nr:ribonuclease Z [Alistipes sp.]